MLYDAIHHTGCCRSQGGRGWLNQGWDALFIFQVYWEQLARNNYLANADRSFLGGDDNIVSDIEQSMFMFSRKQCETAVYACVQ